MTADSKLWLKRVAINERDFFKPPAGGSPRKVFGAVTPTVRKKVAAQVQTVASHIQTTLARVPKGAAVARVVLKDEALAKTHRPTALFEAAGCRIVGIGGFGELLVSVRPSTIADLERAVMTQTSKESIANISTIKDIQPYDLEEAPLATLTKAITEKQYTTLKLRLFRHQDPVIDGALEGALLAQLDAFEIPNEALEYAQGIAIFRLDSVPPQHVRDLARFVGTQSLGAFPEYHVVRPAAQPVGRLTPAHFPPPQASTTYPIVGVIDSGVDPSNKLLAPWVVARENYVAAGDHDHEHGTFVGGLIVHARTLNHDDSRFPSSPCRIVDVVAFPRTGTLPEHELLAILREVVPKYRDVLVWNLSLGGATPCSDHAFSDLAIALDELQTLHKITFVLASGNFVVPPYRGWPPTAIPKDGDRICGPADSARALTVGSVAHRDSTSSRVRANSPSPFSRRGPGPVHLPKPEVTHYGGNCEAGGAHAQIGVLSVDASGNLAESIGTSFAAPTVAALLAHVQAAPKEPLSNLMAKALVIHSAVLANGDLPPGDFHYRGFGIPGDAADIFRCEPWSATLMFETELIAGLDLERFPFAMPDCLRLPSGAFRGELTVALAYEPPLDGAYGAEYCRTNVDLSFGTRKTNKKGKLAHTRQATPFPDRGTSTAKEKKLVEHGFKWSPIKVYRRVIPNGVRGDSWRLVLGATDRSGAVNTPIPVAMVLTIADIERKQPVYNDMVSAMNKAGWASSDVVLRVSPRLKT